MRARANRTGSSTSRAIARACRARSGLSAAPTHRPSAALSASARARTAGATSGCCASRSARAVSNQVSPSRMRRGCHSGCSEDASANASSTSEFSRLHPNAARRLSISSVGLLDALLIITARRRVEQGGHRRVVIAMTRAHGVGFAGLAELFLRVLAHRLQQPVSRSAAGVFGHDERLVHQQGELIEHLVALHLASTGDRLGGFEVEATQECGQPAEQALARARSTARATSPPRRAGSAGGARRCAHRRSTAGSGHAGCRGSRPATTPAPVPRPARSPAATHPGARRSRATSAALSSVRVKSGRAWRARSVNSSMASSVSDSDGTRQLTSPATPIGSRLVANSVNRGHASSSATTSSALASSRCSQLSSTTSI